MPDPSISLSIIIPTLQESKEIRAALALFPAELKRRHRAEVIVSDGGSTDDTAEIARHEADCFLEAENGVSQTIALGRNKGASAARGDILIFLNADVRIEEPDRFLTEMRATILQNDVAGATCNVLVFEEEERTSDRLFHRTFNLYCRFLNWIGLGMARGECHVIRRTVFKEAGGYDERIAAGEDFELFMRLRRRGRIAFVNSLTVRESPRRYRAFGYTRIVWLWFINSISVALFHRSLSKAWIPVR
jgi:glycosyltransferase involved in cell wall biosynthesis